MEVVFRELFGGDDSWVEALLDTSQPRRSKEELTEEYMESVVAFGIHDWSREPYGGAAQCWRPGTDSVKTREVLAGFGLRGRPEHQNIHVCGEAYSDFQGFIEGSIHSSEAVCRRIAGPDLEIDLPPA
jgi:monoamine oxidase